MKGNWIGHILRRTTSKTQYWRKDGRKDGSEEKRRRRRKQLLDDLKEKRRYWELKEAALDRTHWRTRFGRGYEPNVKTDYGMLEWTYEGWNFNSGNYLFTTDTK